MKRWTIVAIVAIVVVIVGGVLARLLIPPDDKPTITVVHWANSHPMREGLLPDMAEQFNREGHTTADGTKIKVEVVPYDSVAQVDDLKSRVTGKGPMDRTVKDPTIITPQAEHWLVVLNEAAGKEVVDATTSPSIAKTVVGIMTYREMAECLGWPAKEIGYDDIIELREDPRGWSAYPCARGEWGKEPKLVFTNPRTSTTGRSVLLSLYAMESGKAPEDLTLADVKNQSIRDRVTGFASLLEHYFPGTIPANTKVYQGTKFGHFFFMPEDNLIRLYKGNEKANLDGVEQEAPPITEPMVMIYPKEGSVVHSHPAALVNAPWVNDEHKAAAQQWIDYLRADDRQRTFMNAGFRPGTDLPLAAPITRKFGVDPAQPKKALNLSAADPAVITEVVNSWGDVKAPAVVTFAIDTSGSMERGGRLDKAKEGLLKVIDNMASNVQVGLVTFDDRERVVVGVAPVDEVRFSFSDAVKDMEPAGRTALFDAVATAVKEADEAPSPENAHRAVVILSDGVATSGSLGLDSILETMSGDETPIVSFSCVGFCTEAKDERGKLVPAKDVQGVRYRLETKHPIQVFFIGVGEAEIQVGRILAQATGAEYQGTTAEDLAAVIEEFGDYF